MYEETKRELIEPAALTETLMRSIGNGWRPPATANLDLIPGMTDEIKAMFTQDAAPSSRTMPVPLFG